MSLEPSELNERRELVPERINTDNKSMFSTLVKNMWVVGLERLQRPDWDGGTSSLERNLSKTVMKWLLIEIGKAEVCNARIRKLPTDLNHERFIL